MDINSSGNLLFSELVTEIKKIDGTLVTSLNKDFWHEFLKKSADFVATRNIVKAFQNSSKALSKTNTLSKYRQQMVKNTRFFERSSKARRPRHFFDKKGFP